MLCKFVFQYSRVYRKNIKGNKAVQIRKMPPTVEAAREHLKRAYHQVNFLHLL